jgi:hypothetical protein
MVVHKIDSFVGCCFQQGRSILQRSILSDNGASISLPAKRFTANFVSELQRLIRSRGCPFVISLAYLSICMR